MGNSMKKAQKAREELAKEKFRAPKGLSRRAVLEAADQISKWPFEVKIKECHELWGCSECALKRGGHCFEWMEHMEMGGKA